MFSRSGHIQAPGKEGKTFLVKKYSRRKDTWPLVVSMFCILNVRILLFPVILVVVTDALHQHVKGPKGKTSLKHQPCGYCLRHTLANAALGSGLMISGMMVAHDFLQPAHAATFYESPNVVDVPGQRGDGGIDAFGGAFNAVNQMQRKSGLTDSDFQKVQRGEMQPSQEPRALKRRVLAACKDASLLKKAKVSARECTNRVMDGELDFMIDIMK